MKHTYTNQLKQYRKAKGYKQMAVAGMLGLTDSSLLSRWERGFSMPNAVNLLRLAAIYGVSVENLYKETYRTLKEELVCRPATIPDTEKTPSALTAAS